MSSTVIHSVIKLCVLIKMHSSSATLKEFALNKAIHLFVLTFNVYIWTLKIMTIIICQQSRFAFGPLQNDYEMNILQLFMLKVG